MSANTSRRSGSLRRALRTPAGVGGAVILTFVAVIGVLGATVLADAATQIATSNANRTPSFEHWLGTDELGRDILARVAFATHLSLLLALAATAIGVVGGIILGSVPWFAGRRIGTLSTSIVDIAIAFPSLLLVLFTAVIIGQGSVGAVLAIGVALIPWYARLSQNMIASIRDREYVLAALIQGRSRFTILCTHILPNVGEPLIVNATLGAASALLSFAGLSFLGLGLQPPQYDWGLLLNENISSIYVAPEAALAPAVMIVLAGLGFNLLGEALARSLDVDRGVAEQPVQMPAERSSDVSLVASVSGLNIRAPRVGGADIHIVKDFALDLPKGRIVGIVGESGSGKSLTAQAIAQIADESLAVTADRLTVGGASYGGRSNSDELIRQVGYVFQDSGSSFNPTMRFDTQLPEALMVHEGLSKADRTRVTVDALENVGVSGAERRARQYPHEFSGGMRQRAMIAMTTLPSPSLVIADEPTTALDVSLKGRILGLLRGLRDEHGTAVLIISHDISALLGTVDEILVMYAGRVVERGPAAVLTTNPQHPYTRALLAAVPTMTTDRDAPLATIPGRPVDVSAPHQGCAFAARCPVAMDKCATVLPPLVALGEGVSAACHLVPATGEDPA